MSYVDCPICEQKTNYQNALELKSRIKTNWNLIKPQNPSLSQNLSPANNEKNSDTKMIEEE